jgi:glycine hydroxymethyltransferase
LIVAGASAYPREIPHDRFAEIAQEVDAKLLVDMAHYAGLVAAGIHNSPVPVADFVTSTTHKTLRGPRGGIAMCRAEHAKDLDRSVFPGTQGGPLMHVVAGKAVAFAEALRPDFKAYAQRVVDNARSLAEALAAGGVKLVSGGTDNHLMLVDVTPLGLGGKLAEEALDRCGITCNKNMIPYDERKPVDPSGIRLGTPALTTRGMGTAEMQQVADWILRVLKAPEDEQVITTTRHEVAELAGQFPVPAARLTDQQEVVA